MDTTLCQLGSNLANFPLNVENGGASTHVHVPLTPDVPDRPIQDDRMHHDDEERESSLATARDETCVDADSAIENSVETANTALSLYGYKGPLHWNSDVEDLYVRPKCYAPDLAPFRPRHSIS